LADEKVRDDLEDMGVASDDALIPVVQSIKRATLTQVERNARWRAKNREKYNAWMRDYRARKKGESK
jgi:phosphopantothenate synthetase